MEKIGKKTLFLALIFIASIFVVGVKLMNPSTLQLFVEGQTLSVNEIPGVFTLADLVLISIASMAIGAISSYLLFFEEQPPAGEKILEKRKEEWKNNSMHLKENEKKIYDTILENDGFLMQSELIEKTGMPKASVSRCLDILESRGLAERKRRGMSNSILLK